MMIAKTTRVRVPAAAIVSGGEAVAKFRAFPSHGRPEMRTKITALRSKGSFVFHGDLPGIHIMVKNTRRRTEKGRGHHHGAMIMGGAPRSFCDVTRSLPLLAALCRSTTVAELRERLAVSTRAIAQCGDTRMMHDDGALHPYPSFIAVARLLQGTLLLPAVAPVLTSLPVLH